MKFKFEDMLDKIVNEKADEDLKKPESKNYIMIMAKNMPLKKNEYSKKSR